MADTLSSKQHKSIFENTIKPAKLDGLEPAKGQPKLFMLGGQPGAGKSEVTNRIRQSQDAKCLVTIDPDDLRIYHPKYARFVEENPDTAAGRVQFTIEPSGAVTVNGR